MLRNSDSRTRLLRNHHCSSILANLTCGCPVEFLRHCSDVARLAAAGVNPVGARLAAAASPQAIDLDLIRDFRDRILTTTPQGRLIIDRFNPHTPELLHHLFADTNLQSVAVQAIVSL